MRDYSFEIIYKAGKSHYVPDTLSRPVFQIKQTECSRTDVTMLEGYTASEMRSEQMKEGRWKELICFLEGGKLPNKRPSRSILQDFQMQDGVLYCIRVSEDGSLLLRLVVPQHLRKYALIIAHDSKLSGHPGPRRTFSRAVDQFYWPSMLKDCCDYAKSCRLCQERKGTKGLETKLQALPEVSVPLQRLSLDLTDLHGSNLSFRYVLTMVDAYSRFVIFTPLRNKCASTVTKAMLKYVLTFGAPSLFYSDRGKEFQALIFQQACADLNIKTAMTLPYCPQSNAITERIHGTLKTTLSILCRDNPQTWPNLLDYVQYSLNTSVHSTLNTTPFMAFYSRRVRRQMGVSGLVLHYEQGESEVKDALKCAHKVIKESSKRNMLKYREQYNKKLKKDDYLEVGDLVEVLKEDTIPRTCRKLNKY